LVEKSPFFLSKCYQEGDLIIGAGSGGSSCPPGDILAPLDDFCPPQTFILGHIWDKKRSGEDFTWLILGQKHFVSGEDLLFLENAEFWARNTPLKSDDDLFLFGEGWFFLGQKSNPVSAKNRISR